MNLGVNFIFAQIIRLTVMIVAAGCLACGSVLAQSAGAGWARVGDTVDAGEHDYFGLFQPIRNFDHATIGSTGGDSVRFVIARAGAPDTMLAISSATYREIDRYLAGYELLFASNAGPDSLKWELIGKFVRPADPISQARTPICAMRRDSSSVCGMLVDADDHSIAIATMPVDSIDWLHPQAGVAVISYADVERLTDSTSAFGQLFGGIDVRIAGNDTIGRDVALRALHDRMIFDRSAPPELARMLAASGAAAPSGIVRVTTDQNDDEWWAGHFSFGFGYLIADPAVVIKPSVPPGAPAPNVPTLPRMYGYSASVNYIFQHRFSVGGFEDLFRMSEETDASKLDRESIFSESYGIGAAYIFKPRSKYLMTAVERLQASFELAVMRTSIEVTSSMTYIPFPTYTKEWTANFTSIDLRLRTRLEYFLGNWVAAGISIEWGTSPRISVPRRDLILPGTTDHVVRSIAGHDISVPMPLVRFELRMNI